MRRKVQRARTLNRLGVLINPSMTVFAYPSRRFTTGFTPQITQGSRIIATLRSESPAGLPTLQLLCVTDLRMVSFNGVRLVKPVICLLRESAPSYTCLFLPLLSRQLA
jgi:hypothetical protein